ncbi:unnamed protein product [Mytilus edulis]|uniref:Uncharacterized protein n=1 Tax=Mytilus edulis TaxID=6550 RepID=A0A8S3PYF2_MYTED|nr:unnamed protein product [Mytilus edulis]
MSYPHPSHSGPKQGRYVDSDLIELSSSAPSSEIETVPLNDLHGRPKQLTARSNRTEDSRTSSKLEDNLQVTEKPCSRGHSVGAKYSEDNQYYSYAMSRPDTGYSSSTTNGENYSRSTALSGRSSGAPRKFVKNGGDYGYDSWSTTPTDPGQSLKSFDVDGIVKRMTRPTVSSRGGVDIAERFENKDYVYGSLQVKSTDLDKIVSRVTKPTVASTGGAGVQRKYTDFVYGDKTVSKTEFSNIISRLTKPTVASEGGAPIAKNPFIYKTPPITKTNPKIPNLEKKQQRLMKTRKVSASEMREIVERLNRLTPAYKAKYSKNPHVWVDDACYGPAFNQQIAAA